MACTWLTLDNGTVVHVNMGRKPRVQCRFCRTRYVERLCDYPTGPGKTCDRGMCAGCATNVAPETDLCPLHKGSAIQLSLGVAQ